ncbi:MAG: helix-turn-helix transcriptional regulator [Clostridia bacterium]|nr:helix-turn-helix transcriptional regulator [Clostridia bacterium]
MRDDDDDGFTRSIQYIYENYRQHISIEELTRIARMSRTAYMVRFKRVTGVTPGKFQSNYRVELAKQMLSDTSAHISEIAADVGCFDASHFVRIFSAQCGVTPGEYRQRLKNNG